MTGKKNEEENFIIKEELRKLVKNFKSSSSQIQAKQKEIDKKLALKSTIIPDKKESLEDIILFLFKLFITYPELFLTTKEGKYNLKSLTAFVEKLTNKHFLVINPRHRRG